MEIQTLSGINISIDKYSVTRGDIRYQFGSELDFELKKVSTSISGHFISIISDSDELFLLTLATRGNIYVDLISTEIKFADSYFTCDETKIIALTKPAPDSSSKTQFIQYYSTLPTKYLYTYPFNFPELATQFTINEANRVVEIRSENSRACFMLPDDVMSDVKDPQCDGTYVLREAPEKYLSLFTPVNPNECHIEETEQIDGYGDNDEAEENSAMTIEKMAEMVFQKAAELKEREKNLVRRRRDLAAEIRTLQIRGENIRAREESARNRAKELFARIQKLIESKDGSPKIFEESSKLKEAEETFGNIQISEEPTNEELLYIFRQSNFKERIDRIKDAINK